MPFCYTFVRPYFNEVKLNANINLIQKVFMTVFVCHNASI